MPNVLPTLTIGALAEQTGCTVPTIRYYEEIGRPRHGARAAIASMPRATCGG